MIAKKKARCTLTVILKIKKTFPSKSKESRKQNNITYIVLSANQLKKKVTIYKTIIILKPY